MYERNDCNCSRNQYAPRSRQQAVRMPVSTPSCADFPYAMSFVRTQSMGELFTPEQALAHGTVFPCLYSSY